MKLFIFSVLAIFLSGCNGDVYLHNPRGTNNRLNERSAQRRNANRLFDSQNNNRGGYNVADRTNKPASKADEQFIMNFFQSGGQGGKSYLTFEWTNQHGSGGNDVTNPHKMNSDIVLQYMCQPAHDKLTGDSVRNGINTNTPNFKASNNKQESLASYRKRKAGNVDVNRGMHESWEWYDKCRRRERNQGLFTADQRLAGKGSIYTRQNPTGTRRGYECPEERDYYPYWHPTEWKDIAVLTSDSSRCKYYKEHSFNVEPKGECVEYYPGGKDRKHWSTYNNPKDCTDNGGKWMMFTNYLEKLPWQAYNTEQKCRSGGDHFIWAIPHGSDKPMCLAKLDKPYCGHAPWTRDNHLGDTPEGFMPNFTWTIPFFPSGYPHNCVFRIRYNISTDDYDGWSTNSSYNNKLIQQNPAVDIGATTPLKLAINTAQYGRTFQDRSHVIKISPRFTHSVPQDQDIYNLNIRGKRGNIVQVYPAVEYDFVPNKMSIKGTDLLHIQWAGSNTHNNNSPAGDGQTGDAGEGRSGSDRNNIVEAIDPIDNYPLPWEMCKLFKNAIAVWSSLDFKDPKPEDIAVSLATAGYYSCLKKSRLCSTESVQEKTPKMDSLLNNAPASFEGMILQFKNKGCFYYMCSRNNNFSNRSQKGVLCIK